MDKKKWVKKKRSVIENLELLVQGKLGELPSPKKLKEDVDFEETRLSLLYSDLQIKKLRVGLKEYEKCSEMADRRLREGLAYLV